MPQTLKRNAIATFGLAVFFYWAFMFAKHDPALRHVIPFGVDPYDAVGSFGVIVGMLIALIALVRAFRPYRNGSPNTAQRVYLIRSEVAVVLTVVITLVADVVALARHPSMWISAGSKGELLLLLLALSAVATATFLLIRYSSEIPADDRRNRWTSAILAVIALIALMSVYPERLIKATPTHLLTVVIGAIALFAPMRQLLLALVPYEHPMRSAGHNHRSRWIVALLLGVAVGAFAFIGEMSEGAGHMPLRQFAIVAAVFIGLSVAGLLIAYGFLGQPLGFGRSAREP